MLCSPDGVLWFGRENTDGREKTPTAGNEKLGLICLSAGWLLFYPSISFLLGWDNIYICLSAGWVVLSRYFFFLYDIVYI